MNHTDFREGMADKFRQIEKFAELLSHVITEAFPEGPSSAAPLRVVDMSLDCDPDELKITSVTGPDSFTATDTPVIRVP